MIRPMLRLAWCLGERADRWECIEYPVPHQLLGSGARQDLSWYFSGESTVAVHHFEEICDFLLGCTYMSDPALFQEPDFWQHPTTFEHTRKGDCEDHALWVWRKLRELGHAAHLVTGSCGLEGLDPNGHAWVVFEANDELLLLESTAKKRSSLVRPLAEVRHYYNPYASVDHDLRMFVYAGLVQRTLERRAAKKLRTAAATPPAAPPVPECRHGTPRGALSS